MTSETQREWWAVAEVAQRFRVEEGKKGGRRSDVGPAWQCCR